MPFAVLLFFVFALIGCGSEDKSSSGTFQGLWVGTTTETISATDTELTTHILFNSEEVYILREDEAQIGSYVVEDNGHLTLETEIFSYANPDTDNQFYVGERNSNRLTIDSLQATEITLFANYETPGRTGSVSLELDTGVVKGLNIERVAGTWTTTDSVLYINDQGGIIGSGNDCRWEGDLSNLTDTSLQLFIERQGDGCESFVQTKNSPVEGIALIDGEGALHFLVQDNNLFLWQQFAASTTTAAAETDEEAAEEEAEEE